MNHRLITRLLLAFLCVTIAASRAPGQSATSPGNPGLAQAIQDFDSPFDSANRLSGVLLVAEGQEVILHRAYGSAHIGLSVANRLDTRIGIASITKVMTGVVLSQLVHEKILSMEDPISAWIPEFPRGAEITIGHLARHRAGIRHRVTTHCEEAMPLTPADIVERAKGHPLLFDPGTASSYSSAGYTVLVRCMELASGQGYATLLKTRIFEPAGMRDSFEAEPGREIIGEASYYVPGRGELWPADKKDMAFLAGAGSVVSTAEDLWRFVRALKEDKLLVPFDALADGGRVAWTGASNGCFAYIDTYADRDLTCIWVGNSWGAAASVLRTALPSIVRGESPPPIAQRPEVLPAPGADVLAHYVGTYEVRQGATNDVLIKGGELWFAGSMILPVGVDRFWHQPWHCELAFIREDPAGPVVGVERRDASSVARWKKVAGSN